MLERALSRSRPALSVFVLVATPVMAACAGEDDRSMAEGCPVADLGCDIASAACQRSVYAATACMAELDPAEPPHVRTIDQAEFTAEIMRRQAETPVEPEEASWERAYQLIGFLPEGMGLRQANATLAAAGIAAYYDDESKDVTVIERDERSADSDLFVLSHELAHALRDARSDLGALRERFVTSTDSGAAISSLTEGEAMVIAFAVLARAMGENVQVNWQATSQRAIDATFEAIDRSPVPLLDALSGLPYAFGLRTLGPPWQARGRAVVDEYFDLPMLSLRDWSWASDVHASGSELCGFPTVPPIGYAAIDSDRLGLAAVLGLQVALGTEGARAALGVAQDLNDDRMVVYRSDDGASLVAWRLHFGSQGRAFAKVGCCLPEGTRLFQRDDDVMIVGASDPSVIDGWTDLWFCGPESALPHAEHAAMPMSQLARPAL